VPYQWLTALLLPSTHGTDFDLESCGARRSHAFRREILGFRHGSIQVCSTSEFLGDVVCLCVCLFVCNVKSIRYPYTSITYQQPMQFNIPELLDVDNQ